MGEFHKLELEPHRLQTAASEPTAEVCDARDARRRAPEERRRS